MKYTISSIIAVGALTLSSYGQVPLFEGLEFGARGRLRFETRGQQNLDSSIANTFNIKPYIKTTEWEGFSGLFETEHTIALTEDFNSSPSTAPFPSVGGNTQIADPETNEVNQIYVQYKNDFAQIRAGRQQINIDDQTFIGGVAWRQNEQTYDAVTGIFTKDNFKLTLGFIEEVHRIFGSDAPLVVGSFEGDGSWIANLGYTGEGYKASLYTYLLDFSESVNGWASSKTYGGHFSTDLAGGTLYAEAAYQTEGNGSPFEYNDFFSHVKYSKKIAGIAGTAGLWYQGDDFRQPLQTAHKFGGFADVFLANQIGLSDGPAPDFDGLVDLYVSAVKTGLPGGIKAVGALHYYLDENFSNNYGWEADAVLIKKLNSNVTALVKAAYYFGNNDSEFLGTQQDLAQLTAQLDFKF